MVQRIAEARLPTSFGEFRAFVYRNRVDSTEHLVLVMGTIDPDRPVRVRAHREYLPGDVFGYSPRNTRSLLQAAMERIAAIGEGVILYLKRESDAIASGHRQQPRPAARRNWYFAQHSSEPARSRFPRLWNRCADPARRRRAQNDPAVRPDAPAGQSAGYGLEIIGSEPLSDGEAELTAEVDGTAGRAIAAY